MKTWLNLPLIIKGKKCVTVFHNGFSYHSKYSFSSLRHANIKNIILAKVKEHEPLTNKWSQFIILTDKWWYVQIFNAVQARKVPFTRDSAVSCMDHPTVSSHLLDNHWQKSAVCENRIWSDEECWELELVYADRQTLLEYFCQCNHFLMKSMYPSRYFITGNRACIKPMSLPSDARTYISTCNFILMVNCLLRNETQQWTTELLLY